MKIKYLNNLNKVEVEELCNRGFLEDLSLQDQVASILSDVKQHGDSALLRYNEQFDGVKLNQIKLDLNTLNSLAELTSESVKNAIQIAYQNIEKFHLNQLEEEKKLETMPGVLCWRSARAIQKVGLYIPGGSAILPSTLMMLGIPAKLAGCTEIIVCTPPNSETLISPEIAYILLRLGITNAYLCGGAQAIAAMAYGTESIPKVDKIFGPGNAYVTEAKIQLQRQVAIDFAAGPSEVLILADDSADANFVASDLLAQAEHGPDSQAILVSPSENLIQEVQNAINTQIDALPRKHIAAKALENSFILKVDNLIDGLEFSNLYAPEHLIICCNNEMELSLDVINAGSVFIGNYSPESAGDYASGTNHTLPTSGFAKSFSGVSTESFIKKITFQKITPEGLINIGPSIEKLAEVEELQAHKNAVSIRLNKIKNNLATT